jgi:threonine synthase
MDILPKCPECGNLLDVDYEWDKIELPKTLGEFSNLKLPSGGLGRVSGVWRFGALLPFASEEKQMTIGEGHTQLRLSDNVAKAVGMNPKRVFLQYEGLNPSGSFKDNGMAGAFTHANMVGANIAACASTGNTSASLAAFASATGLMKAVVFVGSGKIAFGKLSQALDYGSKTLQVAGDFDDAMARVQEVCTAKNIYLVNSLNPFRLEGQKTIMFRILEGFDWEVPDWILVPGGNLGNSSAFGKAFIELKKLGLINKIPRIAIINASGAPTLNNLVNDKGLKWNNGNINDSIINEYYSGLDERNEKAHTLASAIEINRPVNLKKCLRTIDATDGVVRKVTDQEIVDAKALVGTQGLGCEPASAASVAGLKKLVEEGVIDKDARVACVLTGHQLKDPNVTVGYHSFTEEQLAEKFGTYGVATACRSNKPVQVANSIDDILKVIEE